jgi:hypothetical protein
MNATGDSIDPAALEGKRDHLRAQSNWQRVLQQRPDKTSWTLWRKVLRQICYKHQRNQYLIQPLGNWTIPRTDLRQEWTHWHDPHTQKLYHQIEGEIRAHPKLWYDYDCDKYQLVYHIPPSAVPVDVIVNGITWRINPHHNTWIRQELLQEHPDVQMETQHMEA